MESFLSLLIVSSPAVAHPPPFHTDMAESSESTHSLTRHDPCKTSSLLPHTRNLLYPQSQFIRTPPHQPYHITFAPQKVSRIPVEKNKKRSPLQKCSETQRLCRDRHCLAFREATRSAPLKAEKSQAQTSVRTGKAPSGHATNFFPKTFIDGRITWLDFCCLATFVHTCLCLGHLRVMHAPCIHYERLSFRYYVFFSSFPFFF